MTLTKIIIASAIAALVIATTTTSRTGVISLENWN
jgi:hypothetical protein